MDEEKILPHTDGPERPAFTPAGAPLDPEEKAYINNAAYSQVVIYDREKESYVVCEPPEEPEPLRAAAEEDTERDVSAYTALLRLHTKNTRRSWIVMTLAVLLLLFAVAGLLFRAASTLYDATVYACSADAEAGLFGYGGEALYEYQINGVVYTGKYVFHVTEKEYIPRVGDTIKISSFNLLPSWSFEERFCIPGIAQGIALIIACFLFSDGIGCIVENATIRKYLRENNILCD